MTDVADIIYSQLGGNKFRAMTGASSFAKSSDTLTFRLPVRSTKDKISGVRIKYETGSDDYTVTFLALRGSFSADDKLRVEEVKVCNGIYAEQLTEVFERYTGLRTSL